MNKLPLLLAAFLLVGACARPAPKQSASSNPPAMDHATERELRRTPPRPTIDPTSSEAAENLVRAFARLLESGRLGDAYMLLGAEAPTREDFKANISKLRKLQVTVHQPGDQEGGAGSIYLEVPLTISGTIGQDHVTRSAKAVLRRINNVPGSTEAQRRWHIERIDWKD